MELLSKVRRPASSTLHYGHFEKECVNVYVKVWMLM